MAVTRSCAIGLTFLWCLSAGDAAGLSRGVSEVGAGDIVLCETAQAGSATRVTIELKAEGFSRPALAPNAAGDQEAKPLAVRVETRYAFDERVLMSDRDGATQRVARRVIQAAAAINGEVRPTATVLRPEVALLVTELRAGSLFAFSPSGPLTRSELELVEGPGDPLALHALLPGKPKAVGDRWVVGALAAKSLTSYDSLAANSLEATLESADEASVRIKLGGEVRGAATGGEGTIKCAGFCTFDRKLGRIDHLSLTRTETRKPGPVEAGLDIKSTLTVDRRSAPTPAELTDAALAALQVTSVPELELLLFQSADGRYSLLHDRDWHLFTEGSRQTVLKWLDHGETIAQCNLAAGPNAGKGRHQDLGQFRGDIRRALGQRFDRIVGAGEVEGPADGVFRYRVAVAGKEGDVGVLWYYYLIASPEGDQLLATFTLGEAHARQFGEQDLRLIGTFAWTQPQAGRSEGPKSP